MTLFVASFKTLTSKDPKPMSYFITIFPGFFLICKLPFSEYKLENSKEFEYSYHSF